MVGMILEVHCQLIDDASPADPDGRSGVPFAPGHGSAWPLPARHWPQCRAPGIALKRGRCIATWQA